MQVLGGRGCTTAAIAAAFTTVLVQIVGAFTVSRGASTLNIVIIACSRICEVVKTL